MAKYHISHDGTPRICKASQTACPLGTGAEHYSSREEAAQAYERSMAAEVNPTVKGSSRRLKSALSAAFGEAKASELSLAQLQAAGEQLEAELLSRLKLAAFPEEPTREERESYAQELASLLRELDGQASTPALEIAGPLAKQLTEAISMLPAGAVARVKHPIYTKKINLNNQQHDGYHVAQAEVYRTGEPEHHSAFLLGKQQVGDYVLNSSLGMSLQELNDEAYTSFAVAQVTRIPEGLKAGTSVLEYTKLAYRPEGLIIDLIKDGVLDGGARLVAGREEDFQARAPEWAKAIESSYSTVGYYAGKAPSGAQARGFKYRKVASEFTVTAADGSKHEVKRPLYEQQEKTLSYSAHTIAAKVYPHGPSHSVLLHEFTHALQSQAGGIPGEKELFQQLQQDAPKLVKSDKYSYYEGLPDEYMGAGGGRELFTRATEALFYPQNGDNDFLLKAGDSHAPLRRWSLGAWAALTLQEK